MTSVSSITNAVYSVSNSGSGHAAIAVDSQGNVVINGNLTVSPPPPTNASILMGQISTGGQGPLGIVGPVGPTGIAGAVGQIGTGILAATMPPGYLNPYPLLRQIPWSAEPFDALHPVMDYDLTRQELQIHLHAWKGSDGADILDQTVIMMPDNQPHLCFGSTESRDRFTAWRARYQGLFGDQPIDQHGLPSLVPGRRALTFVTLASPAMPQDRLIEFLIWFSGNVRNPFYYTHGIFAFEDDADAFAFQMQFKGT